MVLRSSRTLLYMHKLFCTIFFFQAIKIHSDIIAGYICRINRAQCIALAIKNAIEYAKLGGQNIIPWMTKEKYLCGLDKTFLFLYLLPFITKYLSLNWALATTKHTLIERAKFYDKQAMSDKRSLKFVEHAVVVYVCMKNVYMFFPTLTKQNILAFKRRDKWLMFCLYWFFFLCLKLLLPQPSFLVMS